MFLIRGERPLNAILVILVFNKLLKLFDVSDGQ